MSDVYIGWTLVTPGEAGVALGAAVRYCRWGRSLLILGEAGVIKCEAGVTPGEAGVALGAAVRYCRWGRSLLILGEAGVIKCEAGVTLGEAGRYPRCGRSLL